MVEAKFVVAGRPLGRLAVLQGRRGGAQLQPIRHSLHQGTRTRAPRPQSRPFASAFGSGLYIVRWLVYV